MTEDHSPETVSWLWIRSKHKHSSSNNNHRTDTIPTVNTETDHDPLLEGGLPLRAAEETTAEAIAAAAVVDTHPAATAVVRGVDHLPAATTGLSSKVGNTVDSSNNNNTMPPAATAAATCLQTDTTVVLVTAVVLALDRPRGILPGAAEDPTPAAAAPMGTDSDTVVRITRPIATVVWMFQQPTTEGVLLHRIIVVDHHRSTLLGDLLPATPIITAITRRSINSSSINNSSKEVQSSRAREKA